MAIINLSNAALTEGALIEPAWYDLILKELRVKTAASGNSTNYFMEFVVESHEDKPVVKTMVNDSLGMAKVRDLIGAIEGKTVAQMIEEAKKNNGNIAIDTDDLEGRKLKGRLTHTKNREDVLVNDFSEFLPITSEAVL